MARFRKRPVVVEAVQWFKDGDHDAVGRFDYPGGRVHYMIPTLEGNMEVSRGDWIITGVNGEHSPCKPDIFEKTYEPVDEGSEIRA